MNKFVYSMCIVILMIVISSCRETTPENETTPERIEGMINRGDEINGMVFTTTDEIDWQIGLHVYCDMESAERTDTSATFPCFASTGNSVFFNCFGIAYDTEKEAKKQWKNSKLEITFDGQEIYPPSFGFIETEDGTGEYKYVRMWNLKVENLQPGNHSIVCTKDYEGEDEDGTTIWNFSVSDGPERFPVLSEAIIPRVQLYSSEKADINYVMYIPGEYGVNPEREWPLILYLHGGDRVNSTVRILKNDYLLSKLANQDYFSFIVVAPQGTGEYEFWATDEMVDSILTLLDEIQGVLTVDPNRIYLTGVSAGGNGTWSIGLRHPERFAALAPVMGYYGWPFTVPENICDLEDVPVWAFHGEKDETIPLDAEQSLVNALKACGGDVQFTVFPGIGHDVNQEKVYSSELYEWLLEQKRK